MRKGKRLRLMYHRVLLGPFPLFFVVALVASSGAAEQPDADRFGPIDWAEPARLASRSLLLDVAVEGDQVVVVGERGHILLSEDQGATWRQADVPTRSTLTGVAMIGGSHLWAVGHDAVIVASSDSGRTWVRQFYAPDEERPLLDVWFENASHGIAVGAYGLFLETADGGATWQQRTVDEEERHWNAIGCSRDGTLYVAAESGVVFRSQDKGKKWDRIETPYKGSYFGVLALSDESVMVFGLRGNVYRSSDGGLRWGQIPTETKASLLGGCQLADGTIVLVGLSGTVLVGLDSGATFVSANRPDRKGVAAAAEVAARKKLLLVGEGGIEWMDRPAVSPERHTP